MDATNKRKVSSRQRVADVGILLSLGALLFGATAMCTCPGVFVIMVLSAAAAIVCGARLQRLFAIGLLLIAIAGFILEFRTMRHESEQMLRIQERAKQQSQSH